jgi:hypothetical protein
MLNLVLLFFLSGSTLSLMNVDHHWRLVLRHCGWSSVHALQQCARRFYRIGREKLRAVVLFVFH